MSKQGRAKQQETEAAVVRSAEEFLRQPGRLSWAEQQEAQRKATVLKAARDLYYKLYARDYYPEEVCNSQVHVRVPLRDLARELELRGSRVEGMRLSEGGVFTRELLTGSQATERLAVYRLDVDDAPIYAVVVYFKCRNKWYNTVAWLGDRLRQYAEEWVYSTPRFDPYRHTILEGPLQSEHHLAWVITTDESEVIRWAQQVEANYS